MRRLLILVTALALTLTGCGGLAEVSQKGGTGDRTPVTIELWSFFTGREKAVVDRAVAGFHRKYPWITVKHVGGQNDDTMIQAVRAADPPDIELGQVTEAVPSYCSSGAWQDLGPYIRRDHVDTGQFPAATAGYTTGGGKRCAMPMLADTYGLYYNKALLAKAGFTHPPRTWEELTRMAERLTVRNPDGSIKVAGFVPFLDFYENNAQTVTAGWNLDWYAHDGTSALAHDPHWQQMLHWQRKLIDFYGYRDLQRFVTGVGKEFSSQNAFDTGKLAISVDGEWRSSFIAAEHAGLDYATAPLPNTEPAQYGSGYLAGTTVGIPKGSHHPQAAWLLADYLATDTSAQVSMARGLHNVPTTKAALASPKVHGDPAFDTFLDIAANPRSVSVPGTPAATAPKEAVTGFIQKWQSGAVSDLAAGLRGAAHQVDGQIHQAKEGTAP